MANDYIIEAEIKKNEQLDNEYEQRERNYKECQEACT